jgi:hypothetical protein
MKNLTEIQFKEISEQIDLCFNCFINKQTSELVFIPSLFDTDSYDTEFFDDEIEKIEANTNDYYKIECPNSNISFKFMLEFTESIDDREKIKSKLIEALNKNKPFREFKFTLDNSDIFRMKWFEFKSNKLIQYVKEQYYSQTIV